MPSTLQDERQLVLDLLSVHLIRHVDGNTIISFHPETESLTTSAEYLHERIRFAGKFVTFIIYSLAKLDQDKACTGRKSSRLPRILHLCFLPSFGMQCTRGMKPWRICMRTSANW